MEVIGIDIGGTKIQAGVINDSGQVTRRITVPTPVQEGRAGMINQLANMINEYKAAFPQVAAIGIGSAGRIHRQTGKVLYATDNLPGWTGTELKKSLESRCDIPVFVENDVNTAALGEGWLGAGRKYNHYALLTIGTGIGGALVHDGALLSGPTGSVGEIGHTILYPNGKVCNCGQKGCLEQYVSGTALMAMAKEIHPEWDSRKLIEQAQAAHGASVQKLEIFVRHLAISLVTLHHVYDPELIIIGGGVGETFALWQETLANELALLTPRAPFAIVPAELGDHAGLLGAAYLALQELNTSTSAV